MRTSWTQEPRLIWSFWAAAVIVAIGGAMPFVVGGQASRISNVFIPFAIAALAFAACALVHDQGRVMTSALYLLAGLAIVYGVLTMFALPLMLAVLGTCPLPPQPCSGGLQHPLTLAENTGIGVATGLGIVSLFVGFFGLVVVYRRTAVAPLKPPVRNIPPVDSTRTTTPVEAPAAEVPAAEAPAAEAAAEAPAADSVERQPVVAARPAVAEAEPEPEPELELPAHEEEERPELPPHESKPPTT